MKTPTPLNDALKPCPFCGSQPAYFAHKVYCPTNRCAASEHVVEVAAWNTRANTPDSAVQGAMTKDQAREALASHDVMHPKRGCCWQCGLPLSENPHPDAGVPKLVLEVNTPHVCIPCLTNNRHVWAERAMKAEGALRELQKVAQPTDATAQQIHQGAKLLTDAELNDPEYMRAYISSMHETIEDMKAAQPRLDLTDELYKLKRHGAWPFTSGVYAREDGEYVLLKDVEKLLANTAQGKPEHIEDDLAMFHHADNGQFAHANSDGEFLILLADRLVYVYNENPRVDFVLATRRIASALAAKKG